MNTQAAKVLSDALQSRPTVHIKLLGDSITHGVGGTGFDQNGEPIACGFARNPDGYCWAKKFKHHMESHYSCVVTNNACSGTTIEFTIEQFDALVDSEDDIIICTIGTNNRHRYYAPGDPKPTRQEMADAFYRNILTLHEKIRSAGKEVIFIANIPATDEADGEGYWRILHMNDINDLYAKAAEVCKFPLISFYDLFTEYCRENGIDPDSLLCDRLHPNDAGYDVMFALLTEELGIM